MADDVVKIDDLLAGLDRTGPVPLYYQVSTAIEQAIRSGEIPAGARLENEIAIGQRAGLSRPTIRRAMEELVDKGLLVRRRGIGTQVVQGQVTRQVELTSLYEDLKSSQHEPGTLVLEHDTRPADPDTAEALRVPVGSDIVYLRRQRSTDGVPVAVLTNYLPIEFSDITTEQLQQKGLYEIMRARGVTIRVANQKIGARRAHGDEPGLLDIDKGGPVLTMERVAFDASGRAVEFGHHCYRPDMYSFQTTLVAK
ncbi:MULTISPECIES: GntR family transcriptional regulator [Microbacterium]|uniref:GntR family transcriptional regulator n=1 Tax=Microbacterium TaxID=33882 RepID=UPI0006FEBEEE|nr:MULTISPECIES: GntR family transcriptional regulator [Microbacterium]KQP68228.1 GntR family transcriptional regulator [Microbacterium sp. Leaf288]MDR7114024.1 GntR family transcriptional regulator [Microbacterium trichothecenolyticum]MDT0144670.1 GntR family transcriptional regulator [Microbacterium sp. PRC9]